MTKAKSLWITLHYKTRASPALAPKPPELLKKPDYMLPLSRMITLLRV